MSGDARPPATLVEAWLATRLSARLSGRTADLDAVSAEDLAGAIAPATFPLCLVTAHNPLAEPQTAAINRAANRALRTQLEGQGCCWWPAVGRAADGSWAEPGFMLPVASEDEAAALGAAYGQLAVFVIYPDAVVVRHCFSSLLWDRARGAG